MAAHARPATVIVALRGLLVVFAAAVNATVPAPVWLAPLVMVSQETDSVAVHAQPLAVETDTLPLPPPAASEGGLVGETVTLQGTVKTNVSGATVLAARPPGPTAATRAV